MKRKNNLIRYCNKKYGTDRMRFSKNGTFLIEKHDQKMHHVQKNRDLISFFYIVAFLKVQKAAKYTVLSVQSNSLQH